MPRLQLRTLGRLALIDDRGREDSTLATRPRKLAVLAWLAMRPERRASRDKLIGVFWGEREEARARNSLSDVLSHLRRVLGRDAILSQGADVAIAEDAPLDIDITQLERAAAAGDHARVVELYGGPFLDAFYVEEAPEFADWRDRERQRLATIFARSAAVRCAELHSAHAGDECRRLAERWLDVEPASSAAAKMVLQSIAAPETREGYAAALQAYDGLVRRLDSELGISPDPAVSAFAASMKERLAAAPPSPPIASAARPVARTNSRNRISQRVAGALALGLAAIAVTGVLAMRNDRPSVDLRRVVVTSFVNRTGDSSLAPIGAVAADWISRGLAETRIVEVIDPVLASNATSSAADPRAIGREAGAGIVVMGSYLRQGDSLVFDARVVHAGTGRVLHAIAPAKSSAADPLVAVNLLRERVAGSVAAELDSVISGLAREASQPPTYEAYLAWVEGLDKFQHRAYRASVPAFARAASLDSNFFAPRLWAAAALGNAGDYAACDSALRLVMPMRDRFGPLERGLADMWQGVLRGDISAQYNAGKEMLAAAPSSELALYTTGIKAIEVNRPAEAVELLSRIHVERSGVLWDVYGTRLSTALHWTARPREELAETERRLRRQPASLRAMEDQARALVAANRLDEVDRVVGKILTLPRDSSRSVATVFLGLAQEMNSHGHVAESQAMFRRLAEWAAAQDDSRLSPFDKRAAIARALYEVGDEAPADSLARLQLAVRPNDWSVLALRALIAARRGDIAGANEMSRSLELVNGKYLHGRPVMARARIAALLGRKDEAVRLIRQARAEGAAIADLHLYTELQRLRGYEPFEQLIRPIG
jgi:DNA-binding SARP family transcriptional activator/TolB-like protein